MQQHPRHVGAEGAVQRESLEVYNSASLSNHSASVYSMSALLAYCQAIVPLRVAHKGFYILVQVTAHDSSTESTTIQCLFSRHLY